MHFIHDFLFTGAPGPGCAYSATARGTPAGSCAWNPVRDVQSDRWGVEESETKGSVLGEGGQGEYAWRECCGAPRCCPHDANICTEWLHTRAHTVPGAQDLLRGSEEAPASPLPSSVPRDAPPSTRSLPPDARRGARTCLGFLVGTVSRDAQGAAHAPHNPTFPRLAPCRPEVPDVPPGWGLFEASGCTQSGDPTLHFYMGKPRRTTTHLLPWLQPPPSFVWISAIAS